jgi:FkbM family methyltransferase
LKAQKRGGTKQDAFIAGSRENGSPRIAPGRDEGKGMFNPMVPGERLLKFFGKRVHQKAKKLYEILAGLTPKLTVNSHDYQLIRLGTVYGGWTFVDSRDLYDSTIISCGLGEDASFDIEFSSKFNSKVILVDPTPRAISHYKQIVEKLGQRATTPYVSSGKQPIGAYDLSLIRPEYIQLVDKALWMESKTLKFFLPSNPTYVSHSIVDYQRNYKQDSGYIEVEAVTIDTILREMGIKNVPLIKLDIEGAEIEVILDMMKKQIFPKQILVEFDELTVPSKTSKMRVLSGHNALLENGYQLINHDRPSNFLYVRATPVHHNKDVQAIK